MKQIQYILNPCINRAGFEHENYSGRKLHITKMEAKLSILLYCTLIAVSMDIFYIILQTYFVQVSKFVRR